jgi:pimeloyl-ACP methyl ester carboxylesterase
MPKVSVNNITLHYEQQGSGEPLLLIPFLTADYTCYTFQVTEYAKHFTCISLDLRGTGESDKPEGAYSTQDLANDVAAFMRVVGIERAHVSGLSLGAAVGTWLAAEHPDKVLSLSLHGGWTKTDQFLKAVVESWQLMANALGSVPELVVRGIFPWCFTPELYAAKPDYIQALTDFIRSRPAQPLRSFIEQSNAVLGHDVEARLGRIAAPTQVTFGGSDVLTVRFADSLRTRIPNAELLIFERCAHAPIYESVDEFNAKTLAFLQRQAGAAVA